uniref:Lipoprotein n=1 Tax=Steinernema glaseri TaxID=37863 RepID=A0A1I7ZE43_9BILA
MKASVLALFLLLSSSACFVLAEHHSTDPLVDADH